MDSRRQELAPAVPGHTDPQLTLPVQPARLMGQASQGPPTITTIVSSQSLPAQSPTAQFPSAHRDLPLYGLDIETDTSVDGLDPAVAPVVAVALDGEDFSAVFDGKETDLLADLDQHLTDLKPGILVTWNGGCFDLPFLRDRAGFCGVPLGLRLVHDPLIPGGHHPLQRHEGGYRARWHSHGHLDAYQVFRADVGASIGLSCALKPLARLVGLEVVEVDRQRIHELSDEECRAYVASDAYLARALVKRRAQPRAGVDQFPLSIGS